MKKESRVILIDKKDYEKLREIGKQLIFETDAKTYKDEVAFSFVIKRLIRDFEKKREA
jgi:hypothetical protein